MHPSNGGRHYQISVDVERPTNGGNQPLSSSLYLVSRISFYRVTPVVPLLPIAPFADSFLLVRLCTPLGVVIPGSDVGSRSMTKITFTPAALGFARGNPELGIPAVHAPMRTLGDNMSADGARHGAVSLMNFQTNEQHKNRTLRRGCTSGPPQRWQSGAPTQGRPSLAIRRPPGLPYIFSQIALPCFCLFLTCPAQYFNDPVQSTY